MMGGTKRTLAVVEQHDAEVQRMHRAGVGQREMAQALGVSLMTMHRTCHRLGLVRKRPTAYVVPEGYALTTELLPGSGISSAPSLGQCLRKAGVPYVLVCHSSAGRSALAFDRTAALERLARPGNRWKAGAVEPPAPRPEGDYITLDELREATEREHLGHHAVAAILRRRCVPILRGGYVEREPAVRAVNAAPRWSAIRRPEPMRDAVLRDLQAGKPWQVVAQEHGAPPGAVRRMVYVLREKAQHQEGSTP